MSVSAMKARKQLSADSLIRMIRAEFQAIPDVRVNPAIPLCDALMSAFATQVERSASSMDLPPNWSKSPSWEPSN